jgi:hypothetical protein
MQFASTLDTAAPQAQHMQTPLEPDNSWYQYTRYCMSPMMNRVIISFHDLMIDGTHAVAVVILISTISLVDY